LLFDLGDATEDKQRYAGYLVAVTQRHVGVAKFVHQDRSEEDDSGNYAEHDLAEIVHRQVGEPDLEAEYLGIGVAEYQREEWQNDQEREVKIDRNTQDPSNAERPSHGGAIRSMQLILVFICWLGFRHLLIQIGIRRMSADPSQTRLSI
jgi:hypothetical protein